MTYKPSQAQQKTIVSVAAALLLMILFAQCVISAWKLGPTVDEPYYNGSGYPMVRYNNYKFLGEQPPLLIQLASLPLLLFQPKFPIKDPVLLPGSDAIDISKTGAKFLYRMGNNPQMILFAERLAMILITVLLGFGIFRFGQEIYGDWGALLALFLYAFTPDIIGNGSLFMTDMGLAAFYFFSIYALKRFFDHPDLRHSILLGICCGLTFLCKVSGLILFPIITLLFFLFFVFEPKSRNIASFSGSTDKTLGILALFLIINAIAQKQAMVTFGPLCLLAFYLCLRNTPFFSKPRYMPYIMKGLLIGGFILSLVFSVRLKRKYGIETTMVFLTWNIFAALFSFLLLRFWNKENIINYTKLFLAVWLIAALTIILDYTDFFYKFYRFIGFGNYVKPFGIVLSHSLGGHQSCFESSFITCDWKYFFGVIAVRTPILVLGLSVFGFFLFLRSKIHWLLKCLVILPIAFFLSAAILNKINIGIRHILPVFPFLFILSGFSGAVLAKMRMTALKMFSVTGLFVLLFLLGARTLHNAPDHLASFNEIVGGVERGAQLMPVDWGQDNKALAEFVAVQRLPSIKIASEASNPDIYDYYNIPWQWMTESDFENPVPGFYALAIGSRVNQRKNPRSWFRERRPNFRIGKTFYIYEVPATNKT